MPCPCERTVDRTPGDAEALRDRRWTQLGPQLLDMRHVDADGAPLVLAGGLRLGDALALAFQHDLAFPGRHARMVPLLIGEARIVLEQAEYAEVCSVERHAELPLIQCPRSTPRWGIPVVVVLTVIVGFAVSIGFSLAVEHQREVSVTIVAPPPRSP